MVEASSRQPTFLAGPPKVGGDNKHDEHQDAEDLVDLVSGKHMDSVPEGSAVDEWVGNLRLGTEGTATSTGATSFEGSPS